ncbi:MAG: aminotransferase class I/II-fold pyridoxal phosphate-dependent enzyme [Chloroflexota bacterium]|nr:aminotransferase class I/II-fold pyridoxal phosphate-dependent enzyme [Chloroflexota bacterium]
MSRKRQFISQRVASVPPSGIRRFFDIAATMPDVVSLGIGEPDFITPLSIRQVGIASLEGGETHYTSNAGLLELREAIADNLAERYGAHYDASNEVLVTVGVSEGLYLALTAVVDPGDEVLVPEPCFVSYKPEVILAGGVPVPIPTYVENGFQASVAQLRRAITPRTKAILLSYPNNPTGAVMGRERLLEIAELAEEHDLVVISDELYDRLVYDVEHVCFASLPEMWKRTILLQGFSKAYAMTGWRIGYAAAPAELLGAMYKVHQYIIMCAPTTAQVAALSALREGDDLVEEMVTTYDECRQCIVEGLNALGLDCFEPQGAFYAFPSIARTGMTSEEFAERLLQEEQVAVVPGSVFGECGQGYIRCSYATSLENIQKALRRMERFLQQHGG